MKQKLEKGLPKKRVPKSRSPTALAIPYQVGEEGNVRRKSEIAMMNLKVEIIHR
jgi:hypothetical protein